MYFEINRIACSQPIQFYIRENKLAIDLLQSAVVIVITLTVLSANKMSTVFHLLTVITVTTVNVNPLGHNELVETFQVMSAAAGDNRPGLFTISTTTTRPSISSSTKGIYRISN